MPSCFTVYKSFNAPRNPTQTRKILTNIFIIPSADGPTAPLKSQANTSTGIPKAIASNSSFETPGRKVFPEKLPALSKDYQKLLLEFVLQSGKLRPTDTKLLALTALCYEASSTVTMTGAKRRHKQANMKKKQWNLMENVCLARKKKMKTT